MKLPIGTIVIMNCNVVSFKKNERVKIIANQGIVNNSNGVRTNLTEEEDHYLAVDMSDNKKWFVYVCEFDELTKSHMPNWF